MNKKTIAVGAAAAAIAGTIALGGAASAADCPAGQQMTVRGCGTVTTYPDETRSSETGTSSFVTPAVGVDFRDDNGNRTSSGLSNQDQFVWLGGKKPGKNGDGTLIQVKQTTHGKGGWGSLYIGWVPLKYVSGPEMFK